MSIENVHAESVLLPYNEDTAGCSSLDLVFDIYKSDSFKIVPRTTEKIDRRDVSALPQRQPHFIFEELESKFGTLTGE